ncbi:urea ABC transporter permease [Ralstonia solanacearum]|nr:urea ABC transporter permease [Ralstonia solanacearum]
MGGQQGHRGRECGAGESKDLASGTHGVVRNSPPPGERPGTRNTRQPEIVTPGGVFL